MSIIAALVSTRDGIVGSDGRRFSSAMWDCGVITVPARIAHDDFDKTFILDKGTVIGAFCGLLEFDGRTVGKHAEDIVGPLLAKTFELGTLADAIRSGLCARLEQINNQEVAFDFRKVDLVLVGGRSLSRADMCIVAIRFFPSNGRIESTKEEVFPDNHSNRYYLFGEGQASENARKVFENERSTSRDAKFLQDLVRRSIERGIGSAGRAANGHDLDCGGTIFIKRTWY